MWNAVLFTGMSGSATASDIRHRGFSPELAAYVRTELRGDVSRVLVPRAPRGPRLWGSIRIRLRYWLNSYRGFAALDVREGRA